MANHLDLLSELHYLEKAPSLERLRTAQKRRNQQLKKWAQYEKEMQSKKRKADRKRNAPQLPRKRVSFTASVALLEASTRSDAEEVRYLLRNNVDPNLCNDDGLTALHQCCIDNYEEIAKILLNRGANVNARDNELWTPLHAAATCGHASLVKVLIQQGADLLAVNSDGNMPYDLCEDDPTLDIIEMAMANRGITQEMINEMRVAVEKRMISDIQELLQSRQDLGKTDEQGATLLHIAAANGYIQAAELLLEQGARVDIRDIDGWLPLHAAACWGQIQVAELLVSHGASLNAKTYLHETPIDLCEDEEFKAMLLDLKHKHDIIMKSQLTHKTSLCRRTSSTGSRGKVVRRASVSDRNNRYRKEYETEAIVWLGGKKPEEREGDERERESNQENTVPQKATPEKSRSSKPAKEQKPAGSTQNGKISLSSTATTPPCNGDAPRSPSTPETPSSLTDPWAAYSERGHQTLAELKRQRAATKLLSHPLLNGHLANGTGPAETRLPLVSSNGSSVYYTVTSGDPPLLRLKQPVEEINEKAQGCCTIS
ncbi:protein phosphatase 1 regulatory inhibitor subunit 16B-like isoform X1 [Acipenser ruthenus]|uniref:protein phosphatase 1 regulatory inhibitor subunit 16B-like isoform X1 n=1 Tax=Acipenser ruthenus TaxID=7906 RepID=UPI00145A0F68|nr:protein phosphatase 1 regulatory inhibitor subunit 16B-like isoform X1 [Acipenser ruthenus]